MSRRSPPKKADRRPAPRSGAGAAPRRRTGPLNPDPHVWIQGEGFGTTADVKVPERLIEQVIGQDDAVEVARKAAEQGRNLLLIGDPGTGKSMIARAMAEVLPKVALPDVLVYHNKADPNQPKVAVIDGGKGRAVVKKYDRLAGRRILLWRTMEYGLGVGMVGFGLALWLLLDEGILAFLFSLLIGLLFLYFMAQYRPKKAFLVPKALMEHGAEPEPAAYVDATGSMAGALLGDVRHDPYQSGGLETPAHIRVDAGAIHRAHKGVLFIDEVNVLRLASQQSLLTAMQEKKYAIAGQSQNSSGANIRSEPVPCDFILVAAGNLDAVQPPDPVTGVGMHPALRSRIRGYGYEVYVNSLMDDTHDNRAKLVRFVAQEVARDGRIPHFTAAAVAEVIREAQRRSGRSGKLTLRLRELGGLVRTAGDMARTGGAKQVDVDHVRAARGVSRSLEQQIAQKEIEHHLSGEAGIAVKGVAVGAAYGVAAVGTGDVGEPAGLVVPIEASVVSALSRHEGTFVVGERIRSAAGSTVENVGAVLKRFHGASLADHDVHVDARLTHPGATADGVGLAMAIASLSALENVAVDRGTAFIAEVAVSGALRPVRATLQRIEAAAAVGLKRAVVPASIRDSLLVDEHIRARIEVVHCATVAETIELVAARAGRAAGGFAARLQGPPTNGNGATPERKTTAPATRRSR